MENEGAALIGRVEGVRDTYRAMLKSHQAGLSTLHGAGWSCGFHVTSNSPESALLSLYTSLAGPQDVGAAIGAGARSAMLTSAPSPLLPCCASGVSVARAVVAVTVILPALAACGSRPSS